MACWRFPLLTSFQVHHCRKQHGVRAIPAAVCWTCGEDHGQPATQGVLAPAVGPPPQRPPALGGPALVLVRAGLQSTGQEAARAFMTATHFLAGIGLGPQASRGEATGVQ